MRRAPTLLACIAVSAACAPRLPTAGAVSADPARDATTIEMTGGGGVMLTSAAELGRPCETMAILDLHSHAVDEATGFEELRRWAATVGGDAVVAARFEAATDGETAHLSGVVVRYKAVDPRPYDVLARVEVRTDTAVPDKGLEALRTKASELGADKLVDVRFQHSDDGISHLSGLAVRYRR